MKQQKQLKMLNFPIRLPSNYFTGFLMLNHPPVEGGYEMGWGNPYNEKDDEFILSLCDYFQERLEKDSIETGSVVWGAIVPTHAEFIEFLKNRDCDNLHEYLRVMFSKPLTYGLAQGEFFYNRLKNDNDILKNTGFAIYDKFLTLLEATSIIPAFSPEQYQTNSDFLKYYAVDMDDYISELEKHYNCKIQAPKYQGEHFGLMTKNHGLFSDRDIMALGIAIRIREIYWNNSDISICDIGSGLGYLPYYLNQLGFRNLTYIDIPTITVAAKYFMKINSPKLDLKYISPSDFDGRYDLVINFDGMSSYKKEDSIEYVQKMEKNTKHFISINREFDEYRVCDICNMTRISRNPFWYRRGYIEESYVSNKIF